MSMDTPTSKLQELALAWQPKLRERSDEIEKNGRLPQDIADGLAADGFYAALVPKLYGGGETEPQRYVDMLQTLAQGDASAAWCVMIGSTAAMASGFIPRDAAEELFPKDRPVIHSGVFAPMGFAVPEGDGYRVNGRWQWGSGSYNAAYVWGGSLILEDGKPSIMPNGLPRSRMMLFKKEDVAFHDTWDVSGLCGTGSTDYSVENVYTAHAHSMDPTTDTPIDVPLYKFPTFGILAAGICAVCLGIARASIDELVGFASAKTPQGSRKSLANRPETQVVVARAEMDLRSAQAYLREAIDAAWEEAQVCDRMSVERRRDLRLAAVNAAQSSAAVVTHMYELGGGTSVYRRSPLQRHFHVANRHMMVGNSILELTGRFYLGLDTDPSML